MDHSHRKRGVYVLKKRRRFGYFVQILIFFEKSPKRDENVRKREELWKRKKMYVNARQTHVNARQMHANHVIRYVTHGKTR